MQNGLGCEISARASCSFCFARTCGGIGGGTAICFRRNEKYRISPTAVATSISTTVPTAIQTQMFGISIGALMSRKASGTAVELEEAFVMLQSTSESAAFSCFK